MGLFDGATPTSDEGSIRRNREVAGGAGAAGGRHVRNGANGSGDRARIQRISIRAKLAGLICNRVGSRGHLDMLRTASAEVPVLGGFPSEAALAFPERHLGLLSADEDNVAAAAVRCVGTDLAAEWLDLDAIVAIARSALRA